MDIDSMVSRHEIGTRLQVAIIIRAAIRIYANATLPSFMTFALASQFYVYRGLTSV